VTIHYLEKISKEEEIPVLTDEDEVTHYYKKRTYEDEIQFLKETMEKKKKQNDIRKRFEKLIKEDTGLSFDESFNNAEHKESLLSEFSNTEIFNKIITVMADEKLVRNFKVMVLMLNLDDELGGKPNTMISPEYRDFASEFLELLKKMIPSGIQMEDLHGFDKIYQLVNVLANSIPFSLELIKTIEKELALYQDE